MLPTGLKLTYTCTAWPRRLVGLFCRGVAGPGSVCGHGIQRFRGIEKTTENLVGDLFRESFG